MCLICRFIVTTKSSSQYNSRIGQNTGTSKMLKNVMTSPIMNDFVEDHLQSTGVYQVCLKRAAVSMAINKDCTAKVLEAPWGSSVATA
jgi:hypothetical protein